MAKTSPALRSNTLLAALPKREFAAMEAVLESVALEPRQVLFEADAPLEHVYFPQSGLVCLMAPLESGAAETAAIGVDGFLGFEAVLGGASATNRGIVQLAGSASRVSLRAFKGVVEKHPAIQQILLRYVRFFVAQILQSVACNSLHSVDERCAKWLLLAVDRANCGEQLGVTHEFLAEVLGVHRPSVTIVARALQSRNLIEYSRGLVRVKDRRGLEEAACECYGVVRRAYAEM